MVYISIKLNAKPFSPFYGAEEPSRHKSKDPEFRRTVSTWAAAFDSGQLLKMALRAASRHMLKMAQSALQQLGDRVRAARKSAGLSQSALAENCGMDRLYLGRIELGKQNPTVAILMRIALEAGTDAATLLAGIVADHEEIRALPRPNRGSRSEPA